MVQKNSIVWNNDYKSDGILYFIQRVIEMLDYETIDIFRAPLLNTSQLIIEYLQLVDNSAKQHYIDEVLNELKATLENDIVLQYKLTDKRIAQILDALNKDTDKKSIIEYLRRSIVPNYLDWCTEYLRHIVPQNKYKQKIERAVRCYIPELFKYGYNREDIYYSFKEALPSEKDPVEMFEDLLKTYDRSPQEFSVYLSLHNELLTFKNVLVENLMCSLDDDGNFKKLNTWSNYSVIKLPPIKAMSMTAAVELSLARVNTFLHFYQFFGNYSNKLIQNNALVISSQGAERIIYTNKDKYNSIEDDNQTRTGELAKVIISKLYKTSRQSIPELQKILKLHNRAISNNGLENGFLNLWSILEITCVGDPDASKIEQVIAKLIPILKLKYLICVFEHLGSNLKRITEEKLWTETLGAIAEGTTDAEKIAYLTLCPKYSKTLDSYTDHLQAYPVIRTRLLNLHDNYSEHRRDMFNYIGRYAQRVSWHLYRIYRARNAITHNGKRPRDIKDLGEHLHAYVDCLLEEILVKMCMGSLDKASSVFVDSSLYLNSIETYLKIDEPFDEMGIALLLSAQFFCWCNNKTNTEDVYSRPAKE